MHAESDPKGQEAYAQLVADQFSAEQARKEALDRRAISVVTASGGLITAIAAAAGLITRQTGTHIPLSAVILSAVAVSLFAGSAAMAMIAFAPRDYANIDDASLRRLTSESVWNEPAAYALRSAASMRAELTVRARKVNQRRARRLSWAVPLQVFGIVTLAAAAIVLLGTATREKSQTPARTHASQSVRSSHLASRAPVASRQALPPPSLRAPRG